MYGDAPIPVPYNGAFYIFLNCITDSVFVYPVSAPIRIHFDG